MRSRVLLAGAVGIIAFSAVLTSAASLGGITATSLGADSSVVAGCDSDGVSITYSHLYNTTTDVYDIDGVDVSGVDAACNGLPYSITVSAGAVDEEITGTVGGTTISGTLASALAALAVDHVAIVIG